MTIRAHDVALGRLREDLLAALQRGSAGTEVEALLAWIPVIEVHLVSGKPTAAVGAGDLAELTEEGGCGGLMSRHALDFAFAVGRVVADVRGSLVPLRAHAPF